MQAVDAGHGIVARVGRTEAGSTYGRYWCRWCIHAVGVGHGEYYRTGKTGTAVRLGHAVAAGWLAVAVVAMVVAHTVAIAVVEVGVVVLQGSSQLLLLLL
jgi:hypothetical protein